MEAPYVAALVAVLLFLATQTGAFLYWAGKITQRGDDHERRICGVELKLDNHLDAHGDQ